ncbi:MAG: hypothetical protein QE263_07730 [Vampirovibrionales bacterium]|nr:hypothetical protein [Vampirovibrionales bacterium]
MTATLTAPTPSVTSTTATPSWEAWMTLIAQQRWDATEGLIEASWMQSVPVTVRQQLVGEFSSLRSEFNCHGQCPKALKDVTQKLTRLALPTTPYEWTLWLADVYPQSMETPWLEWTGEGEMTPGKGFSLSILDVNSPQWWFATLLPSIQNQLGANASGLTELATLVRLLGPAVSPYWLARQQWLGLLDTETADQALPLLQAATVLWGWDESAIGLLPLLAAGVTDSSTIQNALEKAETVIPTSNAFSWETYAIATGLVPALQQGWLISARDIYPEAAPTSSPLKERLISSAQQPNSPHAIVCAGWQTLWAAEASDTERIESLLVKSIETTAIHQLLHVSS